MNKISFNGYKQYYDNNGVKKQKFFLPHDENQYSVKVELYNAEKDKEGNYKTPTGKPVKELDLGESFNPDKEFFGKNEFAYRYRLTPKKGGKTKYAFDPGITLNLLQKNGKGETLKDTNGVDKPDFRPDNKFNIAYTNRSTISDGGKMQLIMPDLFNPSAKRIGKESKMFVLGGADKTKEIRNHANLLGGDFNGITAQVAELSKEGYKRIVGTPFTQDNVSSHKYWTQNAFKTAASLGTTKDFEELQKALFANGMNWVSDAALVNEGLTGIHFANVLKYGEDSPFASWFKVPGLKTGVLGLNVLPKDNKYFGFKFENCPVDWQNHSVGEPTLAPNRKYKPAYPSFVTFYDKRTPEEKNSYTYTTNDQVVHPYRFEINAKELAERFKTLSKKQYINNNMTDFLKLMKFSNFEFGVNKKSGFEMWDGNTDIAKLSFYVNENDEQKLKNVEFKDQKLSERQKLVAGVNQVWDYSIASGRYWTKNINDILTRATSDALRGTKDGDFEKAIKYNIGKGLLPKSAATKMTPEIIQNVLDGKYELKGTQGPRNQQDFVLRVAADVPLETLPIQDNIIEVLGSPYISPKAFRKEDIGTTRYDHMKNEYKNIPAEYRATNKRMDGVNDRFFYLMESVAQRIQSETGVELATKDGNMTSLGKYVYRDVIPDLYKVYLLNLLETNPKVKIDTKTGDIDFTEAEKDAANNPGGYGKTSTTPKASAEMILSKMENKSFTYPYKENTIELFKKIIEARMSGKSLNVYKMSEALVERTESGLGWRLDAAKDVAPIDDVRAGVLSADKAWQQATDFWKMFTKTVTEINPHAYTTAEITDLATLIPKKTGRYVDQVDAESKFIRETGITTPANYSYFYSLIPEMYGRNVEYGHQSGDFGNVKSLQQKIDGIGSGWNGNPGFLYSAPLDGIIHSYTFIGNHDKPRVLHSLATDMQLFYSDMKSPQAKKTAAYVLGKDEKDIRFDSVSPKAIAMGLLMKQGFGKVLGKTDKNLDKINKAIGNIASGQFKGKPINAEAFGVRPFEKVITDVLDEAVSTEKLSLNKSERERLEAGVLKEVTAPAFERYYTIFKTLTTLPGDVTDFAGDTLAASGFESKANNLYQQNRNPIHREWLEDGRYAFVKEFNEKMKKIGELRNRRELSALNDGVPVSLPPEKGRVGTKDQDVYPLLRYNDKGSMTVTLYTTAGYEREPDNQDFLGERQNRMMPKRESVELGSIALTTYKDLRQGLPGGVKEGTTFKNVREDDKNEYVVVRNGDRYVLKNKKGKIVIKPEDYNAMILYKVK